MIQKLSVKHFKSIKELNMDCARINLFIGEPNTGKSNMLEVLGLLSWCGQQEKNPLKDFVRYQYMQNLFYDDLIDESVMVTIKIEKEFDLQLKFNDDYFNLISADTSASIDHQQSPYGNHTFDYSGKYFKNPNLSGQSEFESVKYYKFKTLNEFPETSSKSLLPPHGTNMFSVVLASKHLRKTMSDYFRNFGFQLIMKPQEKKFEIQKQTEDMVFSYPYSLTSDTLQRIIFYVIAIESNQNATLVFEEPESHAFPYYTKFIGEKIALDESNQYFIATHNPYLLSAILEKAPKDEVNVCITYFKDYQTKIRQLSSSQISDLMDYDPFFNIGAFLDEEAE